MRVLLRVLVVVLCSVFCWGQLPSPDILALLEFKKGVKHDPTGFVLDSWKDEVDSNGCPSSWNGIMCNGGNVAAVVLDNLLLVAEIDLSVLSNLSLLVKLSLANNSISGKLPTNLAEFKKLEYLDVSDNLFSSSLPSEIGELVSLKSLSLAGNNFSGLIPDSISKLKSLHSLDLSRNSLSGPIPSSLTELDGLVYLNLSQNGFTKSIPKGFEQMNQLDVLDLHGNMLDGELDLKLLLLANASYVDLSGNALVCSINKEQQKILNVISPSIRHLNLSHNQIEGSLVGGDEARVFGSLKVLDLSHNLLSGELPGFNFAYDIQVLRLGSNSFSGLIPSNLLKGDSLVLKELDLSRNNLSGTVGLITSTTLHTLNLSSNMLSGELPLLTGSCVVVDFSRNQFEGSLLRILKWGDIQVLDLSQNKLSGPIPEVTAQFLRLNYLNLSANFLNGTLPGVLTEYRKLASLDLSFNQLGGPLLPSLLASPTLNELHLQNNMLVQGIDLSLISNNSLLRVIDLSNNQFTGDIPNNIGSFSQLQVLKFAGNNFSGSIPTSINDVSTLTVLDLSRNTLTGALPMNLSGSLQSFNVSYNSLSGIVPENLREFPRSSFFPGNSGLELPTSNRGSGHSSAGNHHLRTIIIVLIVVACVSALLLFILLVVVLIRCNCTTRSVRLLATNKDTSRQTSPIPSSFEGRDSSGGMMVASHGIETSRKGVATEVVSGGKMGSLTGFSPPKASQLSWSPESGDSFTMEGFSKLDVRSPEQLAGELYFLDDTISFTAEELSKAPAEVLGRSSHGTSYRATLENGMFLTVKWLRDGVAKQKKEFAKEAKKFANIRHPNVVGLRGYYWGPTQHEKLILSDYVSPGSLASFLYDKPGRKGPALTWTHRLKIAVDIARGLNYLHFDRAIPHGNLKATNILLEGPDLNARVADYCLHRLMTQSGTTEQILDAGVLGYRAPELAASRKPLPTFKSDVYAFGVILLELLTGKCAGDVVSEADGGVELTDWVRLRVAKGQGSDCLDAALAPDMDTPLAEKGMKEVLGVALKCIRPLSQRPGIKNIYEDLSSI